jgi:hypothetical protein
MSELVEQGTQALFGDVRVGVMRIGSRDGRVVAQLAVRSPKLQELVIVDVDQVLEWPGVGRLEIGTIEHIPGTTGGTVEMSFAAGVAG